MKLVTYIAEGQSKYGVLSNGAITDLTAPLASDYPDLKSLLSADRSAGIDAAAAIVARAPADVPLARVQLLPVIPNPGTIWCAGMNTHSHFEEAKAHMHLKEKPAKPILFIRSTQTLVGSGADLEKPRLEQAFDFEGEVAAVIGRRGRNIAVADALTHVAGYSCFNDASARTYQLASTQISAGKNAYRSGGLGPCLATPDEVDLATMSMECRVNGKIMQHMKLDDLIFGFAELIAFISEFTWLMPGDVIVSGSPAGVGVLRSPPQLLRAGDRIEVEVSGVGVLVNGVVDQPTLDAPG